MTSTTSARLELAMRAGLFPLACLFAFLPATGQAWLDIPCLFDSMLGMQCFGCGMKSAVAGIVTIIASGSSPEAWHRVSSINPFAPAVFLLLAGISIKAWVDMARRFAGRHSKQGQISWAN